MSWVATYKGPLRHPAKSSIPDPEMLSGIELEFRNETNERDVHLVKLVRRADAGGKNPRLRIMSLMPNSELGQDTVLEMVWFMPAEIIPAVTQAITELMGPV